MRGRGRADVATISSTATLTMEGNGAPYNMAKAALEALALTLAKEERRHGIRVNIVAPGLVETEMGTRLAKAVAGVKDIRELDASMPFGRVCQPEDVANVVRFLVSAQNSYVTGEKINVHGGGQLSSARRGNEASYVFCRGESAARVRGRRARDGAVHRIPGMPKDMIGLIAAWGDLARKVEATKPTGDYKLSEVKLLAPVPRPGKILSASASTTRITSPRPA